MDEQTSFMAFCAIRRDHILQQNPAAEDWELGKILFDHWRSFGSEKKKRKVKKRKKKDPSAPKNAGSAYQYYMKHHRQKLREKHVDITFSELGKAVGAMWKAASSEEKRVSRYIPLPVHVPENHTSSLI
jgi:hypothetical protein